MDWKNRLSAINNKVKAQLFAKKLENFAWVYRCIHDFDPKGEGVLTLHDFNLFLNKIGVFLTTQEIRTIRDKFDYNNDTRIYYTDFLNNVRNDISERLQGVIDSAFQYLDYKRAGALDLKELCVRYRSSEHPHALTRKKFTQGISNEFQTGLKLKSSNGTTITKQEFNDYYADLNACVPIEREDFFVQTILNTWGMTHGKDYVSAARVHQIEDILFEKIRQKTDTKDSEGKAAKAAFKYFDLADSGECDNDNFTRALDKFGCKFTPGEIHTLFNKYDSNQSGKPLSHVGTLNIDEFCQMFSAIGSHGPSPSINPLTTLGKNSIGFAQLRLSH